jgi:hypothetical protein
MVITLTVYSEVVTFSDYTTKGNCEAAKTLILRENKRLGSPHPMSVSCVPK